MKDLRNAPNDLPLGSSAPQLEVVCAGRRQNPSNPARPDKLSRFVGLSKKHNRWKALIKVHGKRKELGSFTTEEAAARCYDRHAVLAWGARCDTCLFFSPRLARCSTAMLSSSGARDEASPSQHRNTVWIFYLQGVCAHKRQAVLAWCT